MNRTYVARGMVGFALLLGGCGGGGGGAIPDASVPVADAASAADMASQSGNDLAAAITDASVPSRDAANPADLTLKGGIDYEWARWKMPNPAATKLPNPSSYDTSTPGIVRDKVTGLTWQQSIDPKKYTWADAGLYCANLGLAGGGWRVPTRVELYSLLDHTQVSSAIDPVAFPNTTADVFWTASPVATNPQNAWTIYLKVGHTYGIW